jgi:hypothetical protein
MGAGFLQDLANQGATQDAYKTTQGANFNYTTPNTPYWGQYTPPMDINAPKTPEPTVSQTPQTSPEFVLPMNRPTGIAAAIQQQQTSAPKDSNTSSFNNPSPLPNYSMYIPPAMMPDINAYLQSPNSLLSSMQDAGIPSAGAGRFSNLLSTNTKGK